MEEYTEIFDEGEEWADDSLEEEGYSVAYFDNKTRSIVFIGPDGEIEPNILNSLKALGVRLDDVHGIRVNAEEPFPKEYIKLWKSRGFEVEPTGVIHIVFSDGDFPDYSYPLSFKREV